MFLTDTFQAVWCDERLAGHSFSVDIAGLDGPEGRAYWESLSESEQEALDDDIFFFVHSESEWDYLYDPDNGGDFYLIKEDN